MYSARLDITFDINTFHIKKLALKDIVSHSKNLVCAFVCVNVFGFLVTCLYYYRNKCTHMLFAI